jgi:hypothetical protein
VLGVNRNVLIEIWMGSTYVFLHIRRIFLSKYIVIFEGKSIRLSYFICAEFDKSFAVLLKLFVQNFMLVGFSAFFYKQLC